MYATVLFFINEWSACKKVVVYNVHYVQIKKGKMMQFSLLIQGYFLGISVAMTIGISGVLCLRNMMTGIPRVAISSALAQSLADAFCAMIVVFGLQQAQDLLLSYKATMLIVAGITLCFLGIVQLFETVSLKQHHATTNQAVNAFFSVFFLALIDPVTILDFMALTIGFSLDFGFLKDTIGFLVGIFLGSATWWFAWCCILLVSAKNLSTKVFQWAWYLSNSIIFGLGLWTLYRAFKH